MSDATVGQLGAILVRFSSSVLFYGHINSFFLMCDSGGRSVECKMTEISSYCHGTLSCTQIPLDLSKTVGITCCCSLLTFPDNSDIWIFDIFPFILKLKAHSPLYAGCLVIMDQKQFMARFPKCTVVLIFGI